LEECSDFAGSELNALCLYKKVIDTKRGYKEPYSSALLSNENEEKSIETLAKTVTKYFPICHRFYRLHKKLLKLDVLTPADVGVKIDSINKDFSFEKTAEIVKNGFSKIDPEYVELFENFLKNGQVDVYPRKGKYSGGYCWKIGENPTFILLNHADNIRSVETLAHEMGHAFHNELSMIQPTRYQGHSTSTAEVASTFFEQVVHDELEPTLNDDEKIILLHNKIKEDINTIFLQIACFNFETEMHKRIRTEGGLSKEQLASLMIKHLSACRGDAVSYEQKDGFHFVAWSHLRMFFYTYTYAFGQLISKAMYQKWKEDKSFAKKLRFFLSSGDSLSPKDLFKKIGIDISKVSFFETGIKSIEKDIIKLESLVKKKNII
jgi:oligoendopeptidase F